MARACALITGASSGIGAELASLCAADGYDLVLVARREDLLHKLAGDLTARHHVSVRILTADLADPASPTRIFDALKGLTPDILINNAGFGLNGPYAETPWEASLALLQVNVAALLHLSRLILPGMLARKSGRILNVASTAAFVPGPFMAMYYASKAFVFSFSLALADEVKGSGVTVTALCPGPTTTGFATAARLTHARLFKGPAMSAAAVAREGYFAMKTGLPEIIAGSRNRWMMLGIRLVPRSILVRFTRRLNSPAD